MVGEASIERFDRGIITIMAMHINCHDDASSNFMILHINHHAMQHLQPSWSCISNFHNAHHHDHDQHHHHLPITFTMLTIIRACMFNLMRMHIMLTVIMIMHHHHHHHHHANHHAAIIAHDQGHASSTTHHINHHDITSTTRSYINNHHDHALFRLTSLRPSTTGLSVQLRPRRDRLIGPRWNFKKIQ